MVVNRSAEVTGGGAVGRALEDVDAVSHEPANLARCRLDDRAGSWLCGVRSCDGWNCGRCRNTLQKSAPGHAVSIGVPAFA